MLFSSPVYFLFFACYLIVHWVLPPRFRLAAIVLGGTIFYGWWNPAYVWVPFALTALAHVGVGRTMAAQAGAARRLRLILTVVALLLPLAVVKYANFVYREAVAGGDPAARAIDWPLPLGISFVTFTLIAYAVDVYRGAFPHERRAGMLTGYVVFFPHLIAGPILRPRELVPQLDRAAAWTWRRLLPALVVFSAGLAKKLIFADSIAAYVDPIFAAPHGRSAYEHLLAIYGFSIQIYCDFSGYTDMAIASALLLGIRLPNNFARPYAAASIVEFWRRWHITLSHWLRDYLYIPLGGGRRGLPRQAAAIAITMVLGGLWHGANWTFVVWGAAHGAAVAAAHALRRLGGGFVLPRWLAVALTFHFVTLAWTPFRAPDLAATWTMLAGPFVGSWADPAAFAAAAAFPLLLFAAFFALHRFDDHRYMRYAARFAPRAALWAGIVMAWALAIAVSTGSSAQFIYFEF